MSQGQVYKVAIEPTSLAALEEAAEFSGASSDGVVTYYFDRDMVEIGYAVCPGLAPEVAKKLSGRPWSPEALARLNITRLIRANHAADE